MAVHVAVPGGAQAEGGEAPAAGLQGLEAGAQARAEVEAEVELVAQVEPEAQAGPEAEAEREEPEEQVVAAEQAAPAEGRAGPGVATTITPTRIRLTIPTNITGGFCRNFRLRWRHTHRFF